MKIYFSMPILSNINKERLISASLNTDIFTYLFSD